MFRIPNLINLVLTDRVNKVKYRFAINDKITVVRGLPYEARKILYDIIFVSNYDSGHSYKNKRQAMEYKLFTPVKFKILAVNDTDVNNYNVAGRRLLIIFFKKYAGLETRLYYR